MDSGKYMKVLDNIVANGGFCGIFRTVAFSGMTAKQYCEIFAREW